MFRLSNSHALAATTPTREGDCARRVEQGGREAMGALVDAFEAMLAPAEAAAPDGGAASRDDRVAELDRKALDEIRQIDGDGLLGQVIDMYLETTPALLERLRAAAAHGDAGGVAEAAHALKSAGGCLGAERLAHLCAHLERESRAGRVADQEAGLSLIEDEYRATVIALRREMAAVVS